MDEYASLSHTKWDCKYHIVFIPKCRRKVFYKTLRQHLGEVFRDLAQQRECKIEEGHLMIDHVHILISIPPKYAVSQVVGYIKGKSAIHLAGLWRAKAQLCGPALLGPWVLREHGRPGRRSHPSSHPQSRERRSEARTDELVALTTSPFSGSKLTGRVSDPSYRFERFAS